MYNLDTLQQTRQPIFNAGQTLMLILSSLKNDNCTNAKLSRRFFRNNAPFAYLNDLASEMAGKKRRSDEQVG